MRNIALHSADAGPGLLREWIDRAADRHPDKPYVVSADDGRSISYGAFRRLTRRIASFLRGQGIRTGDRVVLLAGNSIEHVACYIGVMAYGATIGTVHTETNRRHLVHILGQLQARLEYEKASGANRQHSNRRSKPVGSWRSAAKHTSGHAGARRFLV
jgi:acyl-CoA synthetase (AMP-forming)/AMP-acid ligase II